MYYYLMIKEIEQTGLKYLCKRSQINCKGIDDHLEYRGSGKMWRNILNKHPEYTIKTTVLGLYNKDDLKKYGLHYSELWNIVHSKEWANLIVEQGDGGSTIKNKIKCYNPITKEEKILDEVPDGWIKGSQYKNTKNKIRCYNPLTKKYKMVDSDNDIPDGWIKGGLRGEYSYGPRKNETNVYHNGERKIYLKKGNKIPEGFVPGLPIGSTVGKIGCYNPNTLEKRYVVAIEDIPDGYIRGIAPTTGKKLNSPFGIFDSVAHCMKITGLTRYAIDINIIKDPSWYYIINEEK